MLEKEIKYPSILNKKVTIKAKEKVKYSICSCGLSNKLPYCDNTHRTYNKLNNTSYKSIKFYLNQDGQLDLYCSNWEKDER